MFYSPLPARLRAEFRSPWYGEWMVNVRGDLKIGLISPAESTPVAWRVSDSLVAYEQAVAFMQARAAAIAAGTEPELVWLLEHPPLYTAGTSAKPRRADRGALSGIRERPRRAMTYHGPGQRVAYVMLDLKRRGPDVRRFVATLEEWIIRTLGAFQCARRAARRPHRRLGARPERAKARGQDRRHRHPRHAMGDAARHGAQRGAGPHAFLRHRALRRQRAALWRHQPRRSRHSVRRWPEVDMVLRQEFEDAIRRERLRCGQHRK